MRRLDLLHSQFWDMCLVNIQVEDKRLFAGFAYFDAGLPETLVLKRSGTSLEEFKVKIPEQIRRITTHAMMTDKGDRIEFELL
jgi:hypothetical protein